MAFAQLTGKQPQAISGMDVSLEYIYFFEWGEVGEFIVIVAFVVLVFPEI